MSKGIDREIDNLVSAFNSYLWSDYSDYTSFYGRVFRNQRGEGSNIVPEIHNGLNRNDYTEVLKNYNKYGQCFFDVQPTIPISSNIGTATVWICFMLDLQKIYPTLTRTEATQQAHDDTMEIIEDSPFEITELVTGFDGFTGYEWDESGFAKADMSPHYLFRFTTQIEFINC